MKENRNNVKRIEPHKQRQWEKPIAGFWKAVSHLLDRAECFQKQWRRCRCKRDWRPEVKADEPPPLRLFFRPKTWCPLQWAGRAGQRKLRRSLTRYANLHGSAHPDWRRGRRKLSTAVKEAIMPKLLARILRGLFPLQTKPVSTLPSRAEARALGALLVSQGKRAVVYSDQGGYTVSEVTSW